MKKSRNLRSTADDDPLKKWMGRMNDQRNPDREGASSRMVFNSDKSMTVCFMKSRGGIFSEALFRGVTYSSKYLLEGDAVVKFDDLKAWKAATANIPHKDLCNKTAYGTAMGGRSPRHASEYWKKSAKWPTFLREHPNPSFVETLDHIKQQKFPQVGPLTAMLMAEDLVYAGVAEFPSDEEFAEVALGMKKGACWALDAFNALPDYQGYVTPNNVEAFINLYHDLKALLATTGDDDLLPDIFVFEHLCCKMYRAFSKGKLSLF
ncbi:hypothetical protein SCHPADRAFT_947885 [Schizopora paradoxa]|uniref:Uncharacterized protein n=1 Tax=Schizopora paradoxa TaxID=27342 RepID=A0A0H2QZ15_9AGAM|nr:hypothetical protein SCHPADRAFT_947885 [Schizopora paradoxa]